MKRTLFAILFLLACVAGVSAQEAEFSSSGGTAGAITAAPGSGTAGRIPQFASATSVVDSKMTTSGTNSGTWTLYDSTVGSGVSRLILRAGDTQPDGAPLLEVFNSAGASMSGGYGAIMYNSGSYYMVAPDIISPARSSFALAASGLRLSTSAGVNFSSNGTDYGSADVALYRSAAGTLKVTDGSTGSGDLWAGNIGIGATAVNTTGLYVKAATGMTSNLYLEGTGGIINPVITFVDVGPTTGSITWQSPQMELRGGSGHYMSLDLSSTPKILFGDNADDAGIAWVSGSTLKITDGSTGSGGIGISDTATNTVTDALILRHATTDAGFGQDGFGTGLLFQAENDVGTMHDAASIDAVFTDSGDASEDSRLDFNAMVGGASANLAAMSFTNGADFSVYAVNTDASNYRRLLLATNIISGGSAGVLLQGVGSGQNDGNLYLGTLTGSGAISFVHSGSTRWNITDAFFPAIDNTYDIGTSALKVKDSYLGTSIQGTRTKTLTDNTITDVVQISSTAEANANGVTAGHVSYTIVASDATTDIVQTETGNVPFLLVNENGTVTVTLGTVYGTAIDSAGGAALANTFASSVTGTNAMIRVTSNYDQATLTGTVTHDIRYRVYIDSGTATVTPQ